MDGTATMRLERLRDEWPLWSEGERLDFCNACSWLGDQADFPDMLRFVMSTDGRQYWSSVALSVAHRLPQEEAFVILRNALHRTEQHTANLTQAIARTAHPEARQSLSAHLEELWRRAGLWDDAPFMNWIAFDATSCIAHLLEIGASASEFEDKVRALSEHRCAGNRDSCSRQLHEHYEWLPLPPRPRFSA
jgi:hypothetical protein